MRNYHALAWLQYELLQLGRYRAAWDTLDELEPTVNAGRNLSLLSDLASMRARYVIETRRWHLMAQEAKFANVNDLFAIGLSAARTGNIALADTAHRTLAVRAQATEEGDLRAAIVVMEGELAAIVALAAGRRDEAVSLLRTATASEIALPAPLGLPAPIKPAPELLGEVLVEIARPGEAIEWFEHALARTPNRSLSVLGLARALTAVGRTEDARRRYRDVLANFEHADADLPELKEARSALATAPAPAPARSSNALQWSGGAAAMAIVLLAYWRLRVRKSRRPAPLRAGRQRRAKPTNQKR
jgi:tetratricopeptide (TPR) repeat protein